MAMLNEKHLSRMGEALEAFRLAGNITQKDLADKAGIGKRTLRRLEAGEGGTLDSLVRVLSALGLEDNLGLLIPKQDIRPMERAGVSGKQRQRATGARARAATTEAWQWGDAE